MDSLRFDPEKLFDRAFRRQLQSDPRAAAKELGMEVADDVRIVVKANTKDTLYIPVFDPRAPHSSHPAHTLSDDDLNPVAAGMPPAGASIAAGASLAALGLARI